MIPGKYDLTIYRGSTFSITLEAKDANDVALDFDVEYDDFRLQIRPPWVKGIPVADPLLELTLDNGGLTLQSSNTQILVTISAAVTEALTFNEGRYDLELIKDAVVDPPADEIVDKIIYGSVTVEGEITV